MHRLRAKLTYANVMSTLAVFLLLGGSAFAAGAISGKRIAAHSISGAKLRNNTLGARQIREASLKTVRRAKNAANATRLAGIPAARFLRSTGKAQDSDRLDGLDATAFVRGDGVAIARKGLSLAPGDATAFTPVATVNGLGTVSASCAGAGQDVVVRYASTTLARQFVTVQRDAEGIGGVSENSETLAASGTRDITLSDPTAEADLGLSARLTTVRDAPTADTAELLVTAVARPAGEARCIVAVTSISG